MCERCMYVCMYVYIHACMYAGSFIFDFLSNKIIYTHTQVYNRVPEICRGSGIFWRKSHGPPGNQIEINICCVEFWELSNVMSNVLVPGLGTCLPPPKLSFSAFFQIKFWIFSKNSKRMRWTLLDYVLKTNRLQLKLFLNSKNFSTFHGVWRLFAKTKFAKTRPKLELLVL